MEDIYLIPIKLKPFNFTTQNIYLKDIYCIYPKEYEEKIGNICIRSNWRSKEKDIYSTHNIFKNWWYSNIFQWQ